MFPVPNPTAIEIVTYPQTYKSLNIAYQITWSPRDPLQGGFAAGTVDTLASLKGTTVYHVSLIVGGASSRVWRGGV